MKVWGARIAIIVGIIGDLGKRIYIAPSVNSGLYFIQTIFFHVLRSEIHERMHCTRCQTNDDGLQSDEGKYAAHSTKCNGESEEKTTDDIGGFAELAGCIHKLKKSEKQCWEAAQLRHIFADVVLFLCYQVSIQMSKCLSSQQF